MSLEPTERQIAYAQKLGISLTFDMTRHDVSNLISIKEDNDKQATECHLAFADYYNIEHGKYIGKKALFNLIASELSVKGRELDRTSWFIFRVYRSLVKGIEDVSIESPNDETIQVISNKLFELPAFKNSLKRYSEYETFLWFGDFVTPNGDVYSGASKNTMSYKLATAELKEMPLVQNDINRALNSPQKSFSKRDEDIVIADTSKSFEVSLPDFEIIKTKVTNVLPKFSGNALKLELSKDKIRVVLKRVLLVLLWVGILLTPYFFSWFTLSKRFGNKSKIVAFGWLVIVVLILFFADTNPS